MPAPVPPAQPGMAAVEPPTVVPMESFECPQSTIAEEFIRQYFLILQNSPWQLHHFYKDTSVYTVTEAQGFVAGGRPVGHQAVVVQGAQQIGAKIREHLFHEVNPNPSEEGPRASCEIKDLFWMQQVSLNNSLVVQVNGIQANLETQQSRRFTQTFLLACEPGQHNAYYVNNDMCKYFDLEMHAPQMMAPPPPPPMAVHPNGGVPASMGAGPHGHGLVPVSPPGAKPKETPPSPCMEAAQEKSPGGSPKFGSLNSPPVVDEVDDECAPGVLHLPAPTIPASAIPPAEPEPLDHVEEKEVQEPAVTEETEEEPVDEDPVGEDPVGEEPAVVPAANRSWAAMAAAHKPAAVPPQLKVRKQPEAEPPKEDCAAPEDTVPPPRKERASYKAQDASELEASVFVSGVPNTCNEDKLKVLFGKHGEVVKVSLKAEKHFAIIDFNTAEAANDALKLPTQKWEGAILKVEKRRSQGAKPQRSKGGEGRASGGERGRGRGRESGQGGKGRRLTK